MNLLADLLIARFYPVIIGIIFLFAGCTPLPIVNPVASPGIIKKPEVVMIPVKENTGCQGMLDYYELFSMMEKKARTLELADMKKHLIDTGDNCTRLKLGMVLSQPNTALQDDKSAVKLLEVFIGSSSLVDTQGQFLAKFLLAEIKERERIRQDLLSSFKKKLKKEKKKEAEEQNASSSDEEDALQLLAKENEVLRKKLEQLTDIEKALGEKEQATVKPLLKN